MGWIGRIAVRFRFLVIALWLIVTLVCVKAFPSLSSVASSDNSTFLPSSAPSKQAANLDTPFQPSNTCTAIIVAVRDSGALTAADQSATTAAETAIGKVQHVTFVRDQGLSSDGHARKASVGIDVSPSDSRAGGVVDDIRATIAHTTTPAGLSVHLAGNMAAWRAFLNAHAAVIDRIERELAEAGQLPLTSYDVLVALWEAPEHRLRPHELADHMVLRRSTHTRLLDRLEADGLLVRERCTTDRRGANVILTEVGAEALRRAWPIYGHGIAAHFASLISEEEATTLAEALARVSDAARHNLPGE